MKSRTWFSDRRASSAIAEGRHKGFSSAIGRALAFRDMLASRNYVFSQGR
jgi:hypothetical protein